MSFETVLYDKTGHVVTITLNRPERLNALSRGLARDLSASWEAFKQDPDAWVAIVTGTGERAFCAGRDLKEQVDDYRAEERNEPSPPGLDRYIPSAHNVWKPIIAAVNGHAVGGGLNIVLGCDVVICSENATFSDPHVSTVGWPGPASVVLPRCVPWTVAMRLLLMGIRERMDARRAYEVGLVTEVVPRPRLLPRAREIAEAILQNSPLAVWGTKETAVKSMSASLDEANAALRRQSELCKASRDAREGARGFVEKRKPRFEVA